MKIKTSKRRLLKNMLLNLYQYRFQNRQKGSLIIGLIVTMVIFSILGGAMVYIFSSSAFDAVFGNSAQRAYYAAESGARYKIAQYRHHIPQYTVAEFVALSGTVQLPNSNGQAVVTIEDGMNGATADISTTVTGAATANVTLTLGGSLTITDVAHFPVKNGFFRIGTGTGVYRYKYRTGTVTDTGPGTLYYISGPITTPQTITGGTTITAPKDQVSITSKGYNGIVFGLNLSRTVTYGWILSGSGGGAIGGGPQLPDNTDIVNNNPVNNGLGSFTEVNVGGDAIKSSTSGNQAEAVLGFVSSPNYFQIAWNNAKSFLSYDIQIKISTGVWDSGTGTFDKSAGGTASVANNGYIAGLTFRSEGTVAGQWNQFGVDFAKYASSSDGLFPANMRIYPDLTNNTYALNDIGWDGKKNNEGFFKCTTAPCSYNKGRVGGWTSYPPPPMILLWIRFANTGSGDDHWLAYMKLRENTDTDKDEPIGGIVDANGLLNDWSTLLLRVVEGASLRFDSASTQFDVGDIVTGATSGATGKVVKKIQKCDTTACVTGKDVIILNNVTGTFTSNEDIFASTRTTVKTVEYRPRDNYIWVMYGDKNTTYHTTADTSALNDIKWANARVTDHSVVCSKNINSYIHWPESKIYDDWGNDIVENCESCSSATACTQTRKNDYFKLVRWDALNPDAAAWSGPKTSPVAMLIMGTGNEKGAILRTNKWTTDATVYQSAATFPYEVGFHSLGTSASKTYFDDFSYNFTGQTTSGSTYTPPIQQ